MASFRSEWLSAALALAAAGSLIDARAPAVQAGAPAVERRSVAGQVIVVHGAAKRPAANTWVTLHRIGPDSAAPLDSVKVGADGAYRFQYRPSGDSTAVYLVAGRYAGIAYFSPPLRAPVVTGPDADLIVYDTSSTGVPVTNASRHVIVGAADEKRRRDVIEVFILANGGDRTLVASAAHPTFTVKLPDGAADAAIGDGEVTAEAMTFAGGVVRVTAPIAPGTKRLSFTYTLPAGAPIHLGAADSTEVFEILVEDAEATVQGGSVREDAPATISGRTFRRFSGQHIADAGSLTINAPTGSGTRLGTPAIVAIILAVALGGILVASLRNGAPLLVAVALTLFTAGCGGTQAAAPSAFIVDDFGDTVRIGPAQRIVSLNPVVTEFLFAAGAGARVVGRTHWDHYPPAAEAVADLGNGIGPNVEAVVGVRPDLVILYESPSNRRAATGLQQAGVRTLSIRTDQIADLRRLATLFAAVTGDSGGIAVVDTVMQSIDRVRKMPRPAKAPRAFWVLFDGDPQLYTLGRGSFMHELLLVAGAENVFADLEPPSAQVSLEEVVKRNPDVVIVGPVTAKRIGSTVAWQAVPAVRAGRIALVDSALVGRPGMRLGEAARQVRRVLIGDTVP